MKEVLHIFENRKIIELATEGATVKEGKKDFSNTEKAPLDVMPSKGVSVLVLV